MTFLAYTFRDLAKDSSWPLVETILYYTPRKLDMARLALMVVEATAVNLAFTNSSFDSQRFHLDAVRVLEIDFDHYANVKQRVEEADTKEK